MCGTLVHHCDLHTLRTERGISNISKIYTEAIDSGDKLNHKLQ